MPFLPWGVCVCVCGLSGSTDQSHVPLVFALVNHARLTRALSFRPETAAFRWRVHVLNASWGKGKEGRLMGHLVWPHGHQSAATYAHQPVV